jgi:hypothetical protein
MSFILKNSPTVINIKLTNIGRKLLSQGRLTFDKWALGDSEIDYGFNKKISFDAFQENILRPKDGNPKFLSYILKDSNDPTTNFTPLPTIVSNTNIITNTATERGFFTITGTSHNAKILTDPTHCKQPDMQINTNEASGGTKIRVRQAPTYISNITEPVVGDYLLVAWANPLISGGTVNPKVNHSVPYLWYKILAKTGTLSANNMTLTLDRPTPNFGGLGSGIASGAFCYPNNNARAVSGDSIQTYYSAPYVTDFIDDSVISFLENCICPTRDVPVWNMAIVFTEEVAGVTSTMKDITQYASKSFGGFVRYIEQISADIKKIGIIHFSNASPNNHYGEGLYQDTPVLDLPTIMWHYETGDTIGLRLTCTPVSVFLPNLVTEYRNLVDRFGNVVGKVFNDLKIFVIEDQELLFAMSYKANRNWTLPKPAVGFNLSACEPCNMAIVSIDTTNEFQPGSKDGSITITVINNLGTILYSIDGGNTFQTSNAFNHLAGGTYNIVVNDTGSAGCIINSTAVVNTNAGTTTTTTLAPTTTAAPTTTLAPTTTAAPTTTVPPAKITVQGNLTDAVANETWNLTFNSTPMTLDSGVVNFDSFQINQTSTVSMTVTRVDPAAGTVKVNYRLNGIGLHTNVYSVGSNIDDSYDMTGVSPNDTIAIYITETITTAAPTTSAPATTSSGGGSGCLLNGEMIMIAPNVFKNISEMKVSDVVYTKHEKVDQYGFYKVYNTYQRPVEQWLLIETTNGKTVKCSTTHLFMTDKGDVPANTLMVNDEVLVIKNNVISREVIKNISRINSATMVYNIEVEDAHTYIGENGMYYHNKATTIGAS